MIKLKQPIEVIRYFERDDGKTGYELQKLTADQPLIPTGRYMLYKQAYRVTGSVLHLWLSDDEIIEVQE